MKIQPQVLKDRKRKAKKSSDAWKPRNKTSLTGAGREDKAGW
jgi:hypothetical protein